MAMNETSYGHSFAGFPDDRILWNEEQEPMVYRSNIHPPAAIKSGSSEHKEKTSRLIRERRSTARLGCLD